MLTRLLLALFLLFVLVWPTSAQEPIYLPIIEASMIKPLKSTIAIVIPQETTNYAFNSSAEGTGFIQALAGTTLTLTNGFQKYGIQGAHVETSADDEGIFWDLEVLPNSTVWATIRVYGQLPPSWDWSLDDITYTEPRLLERIDSQWNLYGVMFPPAQANGSFTLWIRQNGSGSGDFWLDGLQVEEAKEGRYYTTYCDGTQIGCRWLGAPHASASIRSGDSRAGGVVTSFWDGFNFFPEKALGLGTAIEELNIDSYAFLPGGELNSSKIPPREFTIIGYFLADTVEELHEYAQRLELELGLNTYPGRQPVRLRYSGARVLKEISANYTGGLEGDLPIFYNDDWSQEDEAWVRNYKFKMRASISFVALDPFWYEVGESSTILDVNDTATHQNISARLQEIGQWSGLGPPATPGTAVYSGVFAIAEDATYVYLAGQFVNWDNVSTSDRIVRYNKQTGLYSSMGTGAASDVNAIVIGPDGLVYIGGQFASVGGVANTSRVAVWDPVTETWAALATGLASTVFSLAFSPDGVLYAGTGGIGANDVAFWDGVAWNGIAGSGANGLIQAMVFSPDGLLYVGGSFTTINGVSANRLATWDGSVWADIGGVTGTDVFALASTLNGIIYIGGSFSAAGGVSANNVASWNGSIFSPLGDGTDDDVLCLAIGPDGIVYIGGLFDIAGNIANDGATQWNGYTFARLDIQFPLPASREVYAIMVSKYDVDSIISKRYTFYIGSNTNSVAGTVAFAGLATVDNEGTISAFPKIVFSRSGGTAAILISTRNERTGRQLLFEYALLDGETLTVDLNPKNRTIISSFFGPRMNARLPNDDFSVWQLLPGDNPVTAFISEGGSPTITSYILYREPYKSWN